MPVGVPKTMSAAAKRQGNEPCVVTLFHAKQNAALSFGARTGDHVPHIIRRRNGFACDLENHISGRETVIGGNARGVHASNHDSFGA